MVFPDEVVPVDEVERPSSKGVASEQEVQMACRLVESLAAEFEPERYRERVLELTECKTRGEKVAAGPEPERPQAVPDLMAALEGSLASASGAKGDDRGKQRSRSRA